MKKLLCAIALAAIGSPVAAPVLATDRSIPLQATVPGFCRVAGTTANTSDATETISIDGDGNVIATAIVKSIGIVCNTGSDVSLVSSAGAVKAAVPGVGGFQNFIHYTAGATGFTDANIAVAQTSNTVTDQILGTGERILPGSANLQVTITPVLNASPLLPGTYNDTLVVRVTPK
jgi:hypothetical protein